MAEQQNAKPFKFTITHHRKAGVTHEAFMKWLIEVHVPKAIPVFKRHGIIGYTLFDTAAAFNDSLREQMAAVKPTWQVADYDCVIEYTLPDPEVILKVQTDPEFAEAIADQEEWVETTKALLSLGQQTTYLSEGQVLAPPQ